MQHLNAKVAALLTKPVLEKSHRPYRTPSSTEVHFSQRIQENPDKNDLELFRTFLTRARLRARSWLRQSI